LAHVLLLHLLTTGYGTKPRCAAVQKVVGYWKCSGPSAPLGRTAALDPKPTSDRRLLDHLVGAREQHGRNGEAERPRGR
jgi:hypothetical protein